MPSVDCPIQWDIKVSSFNQRADSGMVKAKSVSRRKKALDRPTKKYPAEHNMFKYLMLYILMFKQEERS